MIELQLLDYLVDNKYLLCGRKCGLYFGHLKVLS